LGLTYCLSGYSYPRASDISSSLSLSLNSYFYNKNGGADNKKTVLALLSQPGLRKQGLSPQKGRFASMTGSCAGGANKDIIFISEFKGLFFSNPLLSISLAVSLFSMAGIPPLIGFFSKQLVLYSALQNGYYFISVLAIIVSVISCSYYLQIIKILFTISPASYLYSLPSARAPKNSLPALLADGHSGRGRGEHHPCLGQMAPQIKNGACLPRGGKIATHIDSQREGEINLTNTHSYLISTLTFTILLFFIKPSLILNSTQLLSLSLFYI
jgi:NADH-ubiquinone oxidoreductase chain 2